jgi:hypothetical protein
MRCPSCSKRAASFWEWGQGFTAFRHECPHCGQALKASRATIFTAVVCLSAIAPIVILGYPLIERLGVPENLRRLVAIAAIAGPLVCATFVNWLLGSYARRD